MGTWEGIAVNFYSARALRRVDAKPLSHLDQAKKQKSGRSILGMQGGKGVHKWDSE